MPCQERSPRSHSSGNAACPAMRDASTAQQLPAGRAAALSYRQRDERLPLQELADNLLLDLLQIKVLQRLPSLLHAVLAVGQDQRNQVSLRLIADQVQVGHF